MCNTILQYNTQQKPGFLAVFLRECNRMMYFMVSNGLKVVLIYGLDIVQGDPKTIS